MVESLESKIEQANKERLQKYPLLDITNNRQEIRTISETACTYAKELNPSMKLIKTWEVVPRVTMEFITQTFAYLATKTSTDTAEVSVELGNIMKMGIEFVNTDNADKDGTFNPKISVLSDLEYNTENKTDNEVSVETLGDEEAIYLLPEFYKNKEEIKKIAQNTILSLKSNYDVTITDWSYVVLVFTAFMRKTKDYLICHKDDTEFGINIDLGDVVDIGIEKYGDGDEIGYCLYVTPKRDAKLNSKDDDKSEIH